MTTILKLFLLTSFISLSLLAHEKLQTDDIQVLLNKTLQYEGITKGKNLVVFDIDNTLLATKSDIGSDQWFEWQSLLITNNDPLYRIAATADELLRINTKIKSFVSTRLTQSDLPSIIQVLRKNHIPVILLTSRGPDLRDNTEAALKENNIWMSDLSFHKGFIERFIPSNGKAEASFMNGIFMTAGMHKGEALKYILKFSPKKFEHILFIDDLERHTNRVFDTFSQDTVPDITTFRYSREDQNVADFKQKNKSLIHKQFMSFKAAAEQAFGVTTYNTTKSKNPISGFQGRRSN